MNLRVPQNIMKLVLGITLWCGAKYIIIQRMEMPMKVIFQRTKRLNILRKTIPIV